MAIQIIAPVNWRVGTDKSDVLIGSDGIDWMWGHASNDTLYGFGNSDTLDGGEGADTMVGGTGNDIYIVDNRGDVTLEYKNEGEDSVHATISWTLGVHIENLALLDAGGTINGTGNDLSNDIYGNAYRNILTGGGGNDLLDGRGGADTMRGGRHDDTYRVDNALDAVVELGDEGIDHVVSTISYTLGANVENLTLAEGAGAIDGTGNALDNTIVGNASPNTLTGHDGADTLDGRGGADIMEGGWGNDTYYVDHRDDEVIETYLAGDDTVVSAITYTLPGNVDHLTLASGAGAIDGTGNGGMNTLIGNEADNTLSGLSSNDVLDGGAGADTLIGGSSDDTYYVDNAADAVTEGPGLSGGFDTVYATATYTVPLNVEVLILQESAGAIDAHGNDQPNTIVGNGSVNVLTGGAGNDMFWGEGGADTMRGGRDNDTYVVVQSDVTIEEFADEGYDVVWAFCDYVLGDNVEDLYLFNDAGQGHWYPSWAPGHNGTGNALGNTIVGTNQMNVLDGLGGDDTLVGEGGPDTFVFGFGYGRDRIADFTGPGDAPGADVIDLRSTGLAFADVQELLSDTADGAVLDLGNGDQLTVVGITAATLTAEEFLLG
jgi:Ca2+-binding RTX toxin-like protein